MPSVKTIAVHAAITLAVLYVVKNFGPDSIKDAVRI